MRTLVVSDLHLGSRTDADVLRREDARAALAAGLEGIDRLVLLGDVLELRHGPVADALDAARPVFALIGEAMAGKEVVLCAGNHDHAIVAPWLERRALRREGPLGLEESVGPADASDAAGAMAEMLAPARVRVAYPGVWLRDDVYATHGHYLDFHVTVPTFERLAIGAMRHVVGRNPPATPDEYEALVGPVYSWQHAVARSASGFGAERQQGSQQIWRVLRAKGPRPLRARAAAAGFPLVLGVLNRLGLGPVDRDLSPEAIRRAGLAAMRKSVTSLGIDARWVIFGHTHRPGPLEGDDEHEWRGLVNSGSWVHEELFLGRQPQQSPYWPGRGVVVDSSVGTAPSPVSLLVDQVGHQP